jgi:hypothetical protein
MYLAGYQLVNTHTTGSPLIGFVGEFYFLPALLEAFTICPPLLWSHLFAIFYFAS